MKDLPRVMIVDDDAEILAVLKMYLEDSCHITKATSVSQCLNLLKTSIFDLVVIDIKLPEISGTEIVSMIREQNRHFPVVVISGFRDRINLVDSDQSLAKIIKPVEAEEFREIVTSLLKIHGRQSRKVFSSGLTLVPSGFGESAKEPGLSPAPGKNFRKF